MKFKVTNEEEEDTSLLGEAVRLELFLDKYNNGTWTLQHSYVDRPGQWMSSRSHALIPARCEHSNGDTVVGPRNIAMLRTDGTNGTTIVQWRDASVLDLTNGAPSPSPSSGQPAPVRWFFKNSLLITVYLLLLRSVDFGDF